MSALIRTSSGRSVPAATSKTCNLPNCSYTIAPGPADADFMSTLVFGRDCATFFVLVSYEKSVVGPLRSERKYTLSPTHIGSKSLEFVRGTFSTWPLASVTSQIGDVVPPR